MKKPLPPDSFKDDIMADYDLNNFSTARPNTPVNGQRRISRAEYERRQRLRRKRIRKQRAIFATVVVSILALLVLIIVLICKACSNDNLPSINGVYVYESNTEYEFDGKENGCMRITENGEEYHFEYTYKTKGNQLYIDFENEEVTDITYEYSLDGDKLTLVGKEGSAGGTYTLTKK